jgi:hypothetical protein
MHTLKPAPTSSSQRGAGRTASGTRSGRVPRRWRASIQDVADQALVVGGDGGWLPCRQQPRGTSEALADVVHLRVGDVRRLLVGALAQPPRSPRSTASRVLLGAVQVGLQHDATLSWSRRRRRKASIVRCVCFGALHVDADEALHVARRLRDRRHLLQAERLLDLEASDVGLMDTLQVDASGMARSRWMLASAVRPRPRARRRLRPAGRRWRGCRGQPACCPQRWHPRRPRRPRTGGQEREELSSFGSSRRK